MTTQGCHSSKGVSNSIYVLSQYGKDIQYMKKYPVWDSTDCTLEYANGKAIVDLQRDLNCFVNLTKPVKKGLLTTCRIVDTVRLPKYKNREYIKVPNSDFTIYANGRGFIIYSGKHAFRKQTVAGYNLETHMPIFMKNGMLYVYDVVYGEIPIKLGQG